MIADWVKEINAYLDYFFNKMIPKKLIVMIITTVALFMDKVSDDNFVVIVGIYLSVNIVGKFSK